MGLVLATFNQKKIDASTSARTFTGTVPASRSKCRVRSSTGKGWSSIFFDIKRTIGEWIDRSLDHKMILWSKDPLAKLLKKAGEPVVLVEENPTAEMLARWIFGEARRMKLPVSKVTLWENQDSCAVYSEL